MEKIIDEIIDYAINFIEKPNPAFTNLPICPFAKKARIENKLLYKISDLSLIDDCKQEVDNWLPQVNYQALILIDPRKDLPWEEFKTLTVTFASSLPEELSLFEAHPEENYIYHGIYVRREPYPNWQVIRKVDLIKAQEQLKYSKWYK